MGTVNVAAVAMVMALLSTSHAKEDCTTHTTKEACGGSVCPENPKRRCVWDDKAGCTCFQPPLSCREISDHAMCQRTPCPEAPHKMCRVDAVGQCDCFTEIPLTPSPVSHCRDHKTAERCRRSVCPTDRKRMCVWDTETGCDCFVHTPSPGPRSCGEAVSEVECKGIGHCPDNHQGKCVWMGGRCGCLGLLKPPVRSCRDIVAKTDCLKAVCPEDQTKRCEWDEDTKCSCFSPAPSRCSDFLSQDECLSSVCPNNPSSRCIWSIANGCQCATSCSDARGEEECHNTRCPMDTSRMCAWEANGCRCPPPMCSEIKDPERCKHSVCPSGACLWNDDLGCACLTTDRPSPCTGPSCPCEVDADCDQSDKCIPQTCREGRCFSTPFPCPAPPKCPDGTEAQRRPGECCAGPDGCPPER